MALIFLGTPAFAVPTLEGIIAAGYQVVTVVTQPDRPKGRSHAIAISAVKQVALDRGLPVYQPERIRRPEALARLSELKPEVMVVVGYGQIIPQNVIDIAPKGIVNVHASLLPKLRGAAPVQWAIANGEQVTGVTTMRIDAGLDTGDILLKAETGIAPEETAADLSERLSRMGADLLIKTLQNLDSIAPEKQDNSRATLAPILKKEDGRIDWSRPAAAIHNQVRGFQPWPGAYTDFRGHLLHIWRSRVIEGGGDGARGQLHRAAHGGVEVICGDGRTLEILEVQMEGRKRMSAQAFANGHRL
ncbi:MAG: methionyl-tRNA formyltransferase [Acidobacteriota bacterium]|nr:methionyl-tRNA formyltransferase [Acidobacteriota bacterium]